MKDDCLLAELLIQGATGISLRDGKLGYCKSSRAVLSIPRGITALADGCLSGNNILERVYIPDTVQTVGIGVLSNCKALRIIVIPQCLYMHMDRLKSGTEASVVFRNH